MHKEKWTIVEAKEYNKTIKQVRQQIREKIEKELRPRMEEDPFSNNAIRLGGKLEGFWEQKQGLREYRLVFKILNYNSKRVLLCWIRTKPFATTKKWIP